MIRRFLEANRRASAWLDARLSDRAIDLYRRYDREAASRFPRDPGAAVGDVGGGRRCSYAHLLPAAPRARLVAVDVDPEELALNREVDETRVADITRGLPFGEGELRLLTSRAVWSTCPTWRPSSATRTGRSPRAARRSTSSPGAMRSLRRPRGCCASKR